MRPRLPVEEWITYENKLNLNRMYGARPNDTNYFNLTDKICGE